MAEGDRTNNDAAEAGAGGGAGDTVGSQSEVMGDDSGGEGNVTATQGGGEVRTGEGAGSAGARPGDWNPGEQSGGGEVF